MMMFVWAAFCSMSSALAASCGCCVTYLVNATNLCTSYHRAWVLLYQVNPAGLVSIIPRCMLPVISGTRYAVQPTQQVPNWCGFAGSGVQCRYWRCRGNFCLCQGSCTRSPEFTSPLISVLLLQSPWMLEWLAPLTSSRQDLFVST